MVGLSDFPEHTPRRCFCLLITYKPAQVSLHTHAHDKFSFFFLLSRVRGRDHSLDSECLEVYFMYLAPPQRGNNFSIPLPLPRDPPPPPFPGTCRKNPQSCTNVRGRALRQPFHYNATLLKRSTMSWHRNIEPPGRIGFQFTKA